MIELAVDEEPAGPPTVEEWKVRLGVRDADVPWWAVGLLDEVSREERLAIQAFTRGCPPRPGLRDWLWEAWVRVVERARERVRPSTPAEWVRKAADEVRELDDEKGGPITQAVRHAALGSIRAFVQFLGLVDEEGLPIVLRDFHVLTVRAMREEELAVVLLPYEYGKSYLSSIVTPLMDWAEWPDSRQGRVYYNDTFAVKWTVQLQSLLEYHEPLHQLFPWIRRPVRGDRSFGTWSTERFAIGGRRDKVASFEPLTAKTFATGSRYHRVGADDWVNDGNATSVVEQEKLFRYLLSGVFTMGSKTSSRVTRYRTRWGGVFICGTVFDRNDVNYRVYVKCKREGRRVRKFDVWPRGMRSRRVGEVLWPEKRPASYVEEQYALLGSRTFNLRCRNLVDSQEFQKFREADVEAACSDVHVYGAPPESCRLMLGFDPAKGRARQKDAAHPAYILYGEVQLEERPPSRWDRPEPKRLQVLPPARVHIVRWARLEGYTFTKQCDELINLARLYGCPVAVEDNNIQAAYGDYIGRLAPDVRVLSHTTSLNKRDGRDGVEQWVPLFEAGLVTIHAKGAPPDALAALVAEFVGWDTFRFRDLVMSAWIARYQAQLHWARDLRHSAPYPVPQYVRRLSLPMRRYAIQGGGLRSTPRSSNR